MSKIHCNHYLTLKCVGVTCCVESITSSTSSVMAFDSTFCPYSTTDVSINATTTTTTTNEIDINTTTVATNKTSNSVDIVNNNLTSWEECSLVKGMQILLSSLQKQLAMSKSSKT